MTWRIHDRNFLIIMIKVRALAALIINKLLEILLLFIKLVQKKSHKVKC